MPLLRQQPPHRNVYCVLSAKSLTYARLCLSSLLTQSDETLQLRLITDEESDKDAICRALSSLPISSKHVWSVHSKREADERAIERYSHLPHLLAFRSGHPCWRKVTDPLLYAGPAEELIILDPDLYFPNRFTFECTPPRGLLLMWQAPSCLLPDEVVRSAYNHRVRLAHHVDIGVSHLRNNLDLQWLDWFLARLGGTSLPRVMHIEAIVWAALALRVGGGHLDPRHWHCWRNSHWKRALLRINLKGEHLLRIEHFDRMKCFHAGGAAKWWLPPFVERGLMPPPGVVRESRDPIPFIELTRARYEATQATKSVAKRLGYYVIFRQ